MAVDMIFKYSKQNITLQYAYDFKAGVVTKFMAVYLIFKHEKRFRCAPSFNNLMHVIIQERPPNVKPLFYSYVGQLHQKFGQEQKIWIFITKWSCLKAQKEE